MANARPAQVFTARARRQQELNRLMAAMSRGLSDQIEWIVRDALATSGSLVYVASQLVDAARQETEDMWYRGELGIVQQTRMVRELEKVVAEIAAEMPRPMRGSRTCVIAPTDEPAAIIARALLEEAGWKVRAVPLEALVRVAAELPRGHPRVVVIVGGSGVARPELKPVVAELKSVGARLLIVVADQWASAGGWHQLHADEYAGNAHTLLLAAGKLFSASSTFSISEVAATLRVSPHAIRAWERRYKLPVPDRDAGQRRYTAEDIQLLLRIRHAATIRGRSLKLAALEAQGLLVDVATDVVSASPVAAIEAAGPVGQPWRRVADAIPEMLLLINDQGTIIDCNIATARARDMVRENVRGTQFTDMVVDYDRAKAVRLYRPKPSSREGWELRLRPSHQELTVASFDTRVLAGKGGKLLGLRGQAIMREHVG
jgi:PAS domain-containing protein